MNSRKMNARAAIITVCMACWASLAALPVAAQGQETLPSWNDGPARQSIVSFVKAATDKSGPRYVEPEDRIATFDQDGTLWVEHPLYTQAMFALDRVAAMAPQHPEWKNEEPFKAVIGGDREAMARFTEQDWMRIIAATHAGMSTDAFLEITGRWLETAKHPRFKQPYTALVYQPMLEVMEYLRANGFATCIVTGGGQEFVRVYSQRVYGVLPPQVVGSSIATRYEIRDGKPVLLREPKVFFIDDHAGKPIAINLFVGKRPIAAFGNSDGDREMLEWTGAGGGARLMMLVHHDDAEREYAYGPAGGLPDTKVGTFSDSLMAQAKKQGWGVISMKNNWKRIFAKEAVATAPATQGKADLQRLKGRWLRPDGGYVVEVRNVEDGGRMEALYFNPRSIHVAKAEASQDGAMTKVFIELRDVNYPGSTYTLTYDPRSDRLGGIYYQAALQQSFEVVFVRMR